ncbi:MAG: hypothetical protein JNL82_12000 [Myxococcales bacterium]|nr:hypothetical protein [Myxococcales bacterium]
MTRLTSFAFFAVLSACGDSKDVTGGESLTTPFGTFTDGEATLGMSSDPATDAPTSGATTGASDPSDPSAPSDPSTPSDPSATDPSSPSDPSGGTVSSDPDTTAGTVGSDPDTTAGPGSDPDTTASSDPDTTDTGTPADLSGLFLFSISTVIQPDLPFQFLATVDASGVPTLAIEFQPLTLDIGKVSTPRQPFGDTLNHETFVEGDFTFQIDFGSVMLPGQTNPITGSDITADLFMSGTIISQDFVCGTISGDVTAPLMASVDGSTFAAVRVDGPGDLPAEVPINCTPDFVGDQ